MNTANKPNAEREKIIEELKEDAAKHNEPYLYKHVASFILTDRQRIVGPLVKHKSISHGREEFDSANNAICETLKLAGM